MWADKTGTITEGKPRVFDVLPFANASTEEILRIAAAIDSHSTHPLALAVVRHAKDSGPSLEHAENYRAINGKGAEATIAGHAYFVGNHRLAHELGVCSDKLEARLAGIESQAKSVVIVGHRPHADCAGEVLGILTVGDAIRPNAAEALRRIHAFGIRKVVMPSGDNTRTKPCFFRSRFSVMRPCGWPSLPTPGTTLLVVANALRLLGKIRQ